MKCEIRSKRARWQIGWLGLALFAALSSAGQNSLAADRSGGFSLGAVRIGAAAYGKMSFSTPMPAMKDACRRYDPIEPAVRLSDFDWELTTAEFRKVGKDVYRGVKRLAHRLFASESGAIVAPVGANSGHDVLVPNSLVGSISRHLETAFRLHIVDHLALSDLGHAHVYLTQEDYDRLRSADVSSSAARLAEILKLNFSLLYHSAERLKMRSGYKLSSDPYTQVRFLTRNFLGLPNGRIRLLYNIDRSLNSNTVYEINGMVNTAIVIYISANHRGCFVARNGNAQIRFDLSFLSPTGEPDASHDD